MHAPNGAVWCLTGEGGLLPGRAGGAAADPQPLQRSVHSSQRRQPASQRVTRRGVWAGGMQETTTAGEGVSGCGQSVGSRKRGGKYTQAVIALSR